MIVNRIFLLLVGLMLSVGTSPFSMAQPSSEEPVVFDTVFIDESGEQWTTPRPGYWARYGSARLNAPETALHGRTADVVTWLVVAINAANRRAAEQAGNPIPEKLNYDQVTNLNQLASIESLSSAVSYSEDVHPGNYYFPRSLDTLRAGDLAGLVNLKIVGFEQLKTIEAGVFDGLPKLEILHLHLSRSGSGGPLPEGIFDPLANSLKDLRVGPGGIASGTDYFSLSTNALDRLVNLEKLGINIAYAGGYDHLVKLKEIDFSFHFDSRSQYGDFFDAFYGTSRRVITLPPSVRNIGVFRAIYEIQEGAGGSSSPVNVGGGYVLPTLSPSPQPTAEVGQRSGDLRFTSTSLSLAEGESATYQVRATSFQAREMVVNITSAHSGITVNPNRLTFYSHNWQTFQTVTLTASADAADTNTQATIMHSIPASPGFVANNNAGTVSVTLAHTIVEEEEPPTSSIETGEIGFQPTSQVRSTDYDLDDNGLIEISNLAQLHAVRWDLNGDGQPDKGEYKDAYTQAFPSAMDNLKAQGYELAGDLDFGDNPTSWESIGVFSQPFQAVFEGNNHVIFNLFQDQSDPAVSANKPSGLFGSIGHRGQVVNLGLEDVNIQGVNFVGALAGINQGSIGVCSATGRVEGFNGVGGLVGQNFGDIVLSAVDVEVNGVSGVGDLVGIDTQR